MKKPISSGKSRRGSKAGKITSSKTTPAKKTAAKGMARKKAPPKRRAGSAGTAGRAPKIPRNGTLLARMAAAKRIETMDRPKATPKRGKQKPRTEALPASAATSALQRNGDFPNTYIETISVRLEDPDHPVTLTWTGPNASAQETGPFRSSPGAGLRGLNCDNVATSRRSGSNCTPKGTFSVTGFAAHLNSHPEATDVTWFVPARGIALHFYPSVPTFPASHGCVRLQTRRIAQLIQNNSRVGLTSVIVDGTWTKPAQQH